MHKFEDGTRRPLFYREEQRLILREKGEPLFLLRYEITEQM